MTHRQIGKDRVAAEGWLFKIRYAGDGSACQLDGVRCGTARSCNRAGFLQGGIKEEIGAMLESDVAKLMIAGSDDQFDDWRRIDGTSIGRSCHGNLSNSSNFNWFAASPEPNSKYMEYALGELSEMNKADDRHSHLAP